MADIKSSAATRLAELSSQVTAVAEASPSQSLQSYRSRRTTDQVSLQHTFFGPKFSSRQQLFDIICNNSEKFSAPYINELDREKSRYQAFKELHFVMKKLNIGYAEYMKDPHSMSMIQNALGCWNPAVTVKHGVHFNLYGKTLMSNGTEKHMPAIHRMMKFEDIGSFGLTEMCHGSNVRGIKTTATYDQTSNEFIINTPSQLDMKFWIGATAQLANMTVCWAQMYINGKCHGVNAFIVPIRNKDTHRMMPGVIVGDCGPKNGFEGIDNGFMIFNNVRIPYDNLLDKFSSIENGVFKSPIENDTKRFAVQMSSLSGGRISLSLNSVGISILALTIAGRYSAIRKQFGPPNQPEQAIIEYPLTQYRIIPNLATVVTQQLATVQLVLSWDENIKHLQDVKNPLITELHAISSATKPLASWAASRIVSECRQILGGHGYSAFNRFGQLYQDNDVSSTWEGDNNVLLQQTGKFVLDAARKLMKGKILQFQSTHYITLDPAEGQISDLNEEADFLNTDKLVKALQWKVNLLLQKTGLKLQEQVQSLKKSGWDAFNAVQPFYSIELAKSFGEVWMVEQALAKVSQITHQANKKVIGDFVTLHILDLLNRDIGTYNIGGFINSEQHESIRSHILRLCSALKDEYIGIIDSLAPPDFILQAPFGQSDGDIYNRYIGMIYAAKDTFKRVDWWREVHKAHKKYNFGELEEN